MQLVVDDILTILSFRSEVEEAAADVMDLWEDSVTYLHAFGFFFLKFMKGFWVSVVVKFTDTASKFSEFVFLQDLILE